MRTSDNILARKVSSFFFRMKKLFVDCNFQNSKLYKVLWRNGQILLWSGARDA